MLPKELRPFDEKELIRLGNNSDGGYILSKKIIDHCKTCIIFGLEDNFNFEKDLKKVNPDTNLYVYDHTINILYFNLL